MKVNKEKAKKVLEVAIANCKKTLSNNMQKPCGHCKVHVADVSKETKITVHDFQFEIGIDLCENCYDNIRCEINDIDPDSVY